MVDLLRFTTAGSVDDGKSTLIGRLLFDSKSIYEDQLEAIEKTSRKKGQDEVDLALLTDGLAAEREQGITIDVAYRYFATPKRKFIIADTPGHEQYTRNMVTGASTASLAIILIDARKGLLEQSKRHAIISSLLGIPHVVVAVNKMDLVDYDQKTFEDIKADFLEFSKKLNIEDLKFVPISALKGDNVVEKTENTSWYEGPSLLEILETVEYAEDKNLDDFRLPVQYVIRIDNEENPDFRGFAGKIASGIVRVGDEIVSMPSGMKSKVKAIKSFDGDLKEAFAPMSITLVLEDEIDTSRGDTLAKVEEAPKESKEFEANICWMTEDKLETRKKYLIKHTSNKAKIMVTGIEHRLDITNLEELGADQLGLNEIGKVKIKSQKALFLDPYDKNRSNGSFILIDELNNNTVAAGMAL